jgi:hypothetical protein
MRKLSTDQGDRIGAIEIGRHCGEAASSKYRVYFQTFGAKNPKSYATTTGSAPLKVEVLQAE